MKDVNSLKGLHSAKTMNSSKRRSMPRIESSTYLDLYMLKKEKDRLLKEDERLCIRKDAINRRFEEINLEMEKLKEATRDEIKTGLNAGLPERASTRKAGAAKEWKKMPLTY